jgi:hypothetical protein
MTNALTKSPWDPTIQYGEDWDKWDDVRNEAIEADNQRPPPGGINWGKVSKGLGQMGAEDENPYAQKAVYATGFGNRFRPR